jgi:hypothetical protein
MIRFTNGYDLLGSVSTPMPLKDFPNEENVEMMIREK